MLIRDSSKSSDQSSEALERYIGYNLLGPVVHRWMLALEQYVSYFDDQNTKFLYCARAGVRIQRLFKLYREGKGRELNADHEILWASRLSVCKGTFTRQKARATKVMGSEYHYEPLRNLIAGLFRNTPDLLSAVSLNSKDLDAHGWNFPGWIDSRHSAVKTVRSYLEGSSQAFEGYIAQLLSGRSRAVLIDSGWQGTAQSLLHHAYPEYAWKGLYFGRILTSNHDRLITDRVLGLMFEADRFNPQNPATAIAEHRHLIEALLEPNGPSIEEVPQGPYAKVAQTQIDANLHETLDPKDDLHFLLAEEYLRDHAGAGMAEIMANYQKAMPELARILIKPTREEALAVFCKDRSADFGKEIKAPVLIGDQKGAAAGEIDAETRIEKALWVQGQIALEYQGGIARELQMRATGLADNRSYFDPASDETAKKDEIERQASVAIITRTKNRPLLLRRAAASVANQRYSNYVWVIVNDGGDEQAVREVIEDCQIDRRQIILVSNLQSLGMEAASNAGIAACTSDYVVIHDDDDALHPDFLSKAVAFLETPGGKRYGGIISGTEYVSEEIRGDQVIEHARRPYMSWVKNVQFSELLAQNFFAPISFLYRREIYDSVGGYNPDLPVLGDWFFNLEFVLRADIKVLPETLAYYHHRDFGDSSKTGVYANSVIGGQSKHEEFASVFRNIFLRKYGHEGGLSTAVSMGYFASDLRGRIERLESRLLGGEAVLQNKPEASSFAGVSDLCAEVDRLWLLTHLSRSPRSRIAAAVSWRKVSLHADASLDQLGKLAYSTKLPIPPHPSFDEKRYIADNEDVAAEIEAGLFPSGYIHYVAFGRREGRTRPTLS